MTLATRSDFDSGHFLAKRYSNLSQLLNSFLLGACYNLYRKGITRFFSYHPSLLLNLYLFEIRIAGIFYLYSYLVLILPQIIISSVGVFHSPPQGCKYNSYCNTAKQLKTWALEREYVVEFQLSYFLRLCDAGEVTQLLRASFSSSIKGSNKNICLKARKDAKLMNVILITVSGTQ